MGGTLHQGSSADGDPSNERVDSEAWRVYKDVPIRPASRYLVLVVDMGESLSKNDFKPSRGQVISKCLEAFLKRFFALNPVSHVCLIGLWDSAAHVLCEFGSPLHDLRHALANDMRGSGHVSLELGLSVARSQLSLAPSFPSKEILVIYSGIFTEDPPRSSASDTKEDASVSISGVSLGPALLFMRSLTEAHRGTYVTASAQPELLDALLCHAPPPTPDAHTHRDRVVSLVRAGFPGRTVMQTPTLCACHGKAVYAHYKCPRCYASLCHGNTMCPVCGMSLFLAPFLRRAQQVILPAPVFDPLTPADPSLPLPAKRSSAGPSKTLTLSGPSDGAGPVNLLETAPPQPQPQSALSGSALSGSALSMARARPKAKTKAPVECAMCQHRPSSDTEGAAYATCRECKTVLCCHCVSLSLDLLQMCPHCGA
ncbi:TFIIH subunit Ssl1/p44 [Kipferlia bialata]|uniref:TFIIH subunit Ssl1/p44 n=1 Tax=Kipferlia bialata TaxID=797122 RepID=A0A9K3CLZ2_9EUKA|nr:TFIIH subunit Ssl1/p44 [Kipferlia bialata]|eukprot:g64.t1